MLEIESVVGGYGGKRVLQDVTLHVRKKEIVGLVGPNGSGKSTVLKAIFGMLKVDGGTVTYQGKGIQNRKPSQNVLAGISYIPQGNRVFDKLTVQENIEMGGVLIKDVKILNERIDLMYEQFPKLKAYKKKVAGKLSGGERQMVGLCMGLITQPTLLLIDEPSIGLAPQLVSQTMELIRQIRDRNNITVLMVEQNVRALLTLADRVYLLRQGRIVYEDPAVSPETEGKLRELFLQ